MGPQTVDYRVSRVVVCCKDCGQDVGLYPARHKCQDPVRPPLPPLPAKLPDELESNNNGLRVPRKPVPSLDSESKSRPTSAASASSSSSSSTFPNSPSQPPTSDSSSASNGSRWARFVRSTPKQQETQQNEEEDSFYFNNFAAHLPEDASADTSATNNSSGKKLWGKVRQNEKWKQLNEKYEKPKQSAKLWGKLVQATQNMADKIPSRDERGPESDESDWEGESHVSRILREYYQKKNQPLPEWLFDERTPKRRSIGAAGRPKGPENDDMLPPLDPRSQRSPGRKQRLWETDPDSERYMTQREREREELRRQQQQLSAERARSNERNYYDSYADEGYYKDSYGTPVQERVRGPRDILDHSRRYNERTGAYY